MFKSWIMFQKLDLKLFFQRYVSLKCFAHIFICFSDKFLFLLTFQNNQVSKINLTTNKNILHSESSSNCAHVALLQKAFPIKKSEYRVKCIFKKETSIYTQWTCFFFSSHYYKQTDNYINVCTKTQIDRIKNEYTFFQLYIQKLMKTNINFNKMFKKYWKNI